MATLVDTAIATSNDVPGVNLSAQYREKNLVAMSNGNGVTAAPKLPHPSELKYKHVLAIHSRTKPSVLSSDAEKAPSYMGFRNITVLMLSTSFLHLYLRDITEE
jgi:diacylglycerol O-acyltransferase 1